MFFFLVEEGEEKEHMHSLSPDFLLYRDRKWNRFWKIQQGFKISMILWSLRAWITQVLKLSSCYSFWECDTIEKTWIWIFPASPGSYLCDPQSYSASLTLSSLICKTGNNDSYLILFVKQNKTNKKKTIHLCIHSFRCLKYRDIMKD